MTIMQRIHEETGYPLQDLTILTTLDELCLDSLEFVDLMIALEVPKEKSGSIVTVGDILRALA